MRVAPAFVDRPENHQRKITKLLASSQTPQKHRAALAIGQRILGAKNGMRH
jgi:hypothetical protein